jgi:putative flippase GtrA
MYFFSNYYKFLKRVKVKRILNHELVRFLLTGTLGVIVNLIIFYCLADVVGVIPVASAVICFVIVVSQNYFINHYWSFGNVVNYSASIKGLVKYVGVNLFGLLINLAVLKIVMFYFNPSPKVIAQFAGIIFATGINYLGAKKLVFLKKNERV